MSSLQPQHTVYYDLFYVGVDLHVALDHASRSANTNPEKTRAHDMYVKYKSCMALMIATRVGGGRASVVPPRQVTTEASMTWGPRVKPASILRAEESAKPTAMPPV